MKQNKLLLPVILLFIGFGCFAGFKLTQRHYDQQTTRLETQVIAKKKELKKKQATLADQQMTKKLTSTKEYTFNTANQALAQAEIQKNGQKLFKIIMTFNSQKDWDNRKKLASSLVTSSVLNNRFLFNSGKDNTGHSIIQAEKLSSSLVSAAFQTGKITDNAVEGITKVVYASQSDNASVANTTYYYTFNYDLNQHKFTSIKPAGASSTSMNEEGN